MLSAPKQVADGEVGKHGCSKGHDHSPGVCTLAPRQGEEDSALATRGAIFRRHAHGGPQGNEDDEARDPWAECAHVRTVAPDRSRRSPPLRHRNVRNCRAE